MLTPEKIKSELLSIIEGVRNPPAILNFAPVLKSSKRQFDELITKCMDLHRRVADLDEADDTWEETQELYSIESNYKRLRAKLMLMPSVMLVYLVFSVFILFLDKVDITGFIKNVLGVDAPEKLVTFGLSGAFLYLATSALTKITEKGSEKDPTAKVAEFSIRILLAIFVPIILVSLFFTSEGEIGELRLSPEVLAFACGYSAKLVIDIFNKIVEKGSKIIEAL